MYGGYRTLYGGYRLRDGTSVALFFLSWFGECLVVLSMVSGGGQRPRGLQPCPFCFFVKIVGVHGIDGSSDPASLPLPAPVPLLVNAESQGAIPHFELLKSVVCILNMGVSSPKKQIINSQ